MKEALKLALEALEDWDSPVALPAIYAIKEALAQDELCSSQEPVAGDVHTEHCFQGEYKHCCKYGDGDDCTAAPKTQWNPEPEPLTVDVVYVEGDDLFICGVHGKITVVALSEIERDIKENPDFLKGDGVYSYSVTRFDGEYGFEGRCELAPCWELCESGYVPIWAKP